MRWKMAVGLALGVAVAVACSSTNNGPLQGQGTTNPDGGCASMNTSVSAGQGYVQSLGCPNCHGADMAGSTTALQSGTDNITIPAGTSLYPPNLTPDPTTGIGTWTDGQINLAITEGIDNTGLELCPEMGRHYPNLCPDEVTGIIAYLHSIPAVVKKIPCSVCPPLKTGGSCP